MAIVNVEKFSVPEKRVIVIDSIAKYEYYRNNKGPIEEYTMSKPMLSHFLNEKDCYFDLENLLNSQNMNYETFKQILLIQDEMGCAEWAFNLFASANKMTEAEVREFLKDVKDSYYGNKDILRNIDVVTNNNPFQISFIKEIVDLCYDMLINGIKETDRWSIRNHNYNCMIAIAKVRESILYNGRYTFKDEDETFLLNDLCVKFYGICTGLFDTGHFLIESTCSSIVDNEEIIKFFNFQRSMVVMNSMIGYIKMTRRYEDLRYSGYNIFASTQFYKTHGITIPQVEILIKKFESYNHVVEDIIGAIFSCEDFVMSEDFFDKYHSLTTDVNVVQNISACKIIKDRKLVDKFFNKIMSNPKPIASLGYLDVSEKQIMKFINRAIKRNYSVKLNYNSLLKIGVDFYIQNKNTINSQYLAETCENINEMDERVMMEIMSSFHSLKSIMEHKSLNKDNKLKAKYIINYLRKSNVNINSIIRYIKSSYVEVTEELLKTIAKIKRTDIFDFLAIINKDGDELIEYYITLKEGSYDIEG